MKMKKAFAILTVLLLCFTGFGCHGRESHAAFEIPEEFDTSKDYEVVFWAKNDTNMTQVKAYEKAISDFEALYPNINVKVMMYTDYGKIYNDVITRISTDGTPNVCITYPDHIATYMTGDNIVVPLDELFADEKYGLNGSEIKYDAPSIDEIVPQFLNECSFGEHYYAIPYMRSTEACYINKDFVEKLGYKVPDVLTWDFVWEVSEAAMAKNADGTFKINGQKVMIPFIYKSTDNMMIQMTRQLGSGYSDDEGNIEIFNDTTKELLYEISSHAKTGAFSTFKISSYPANFLNAGQCIFAIDSTAGSTWMGSDAPNIDISEDKLIEFETVVREIPQFNTEEPQMISQGPSICIFNKSDNQEVLASWLFAQYLLTNDVQMAYSRTEGYVPVTLKAQNSQEYQDYLLRQGEDELHYGIKIEASKLLLRNMENTFVTPVFNGSASLRDASGQLIEQTVKSTRRKETVDDEYMKKLYDDVKSLYRLERSNNATGGKAELGALPAESIWLISVLVFVWLLLGIYELRELLKNKKRQ